MNSFWYVIGGAIVLYGAVITFGYYKRRYQADHISEENLRHIQRHHSTRGWIGPSWRFPAEVDRLNQQRSGVME